MTTLLPQACVGSVAALASRTVWVLLRRRPPGGPSGWQRHNHRGEVVTLLEGPAYALGALLAVLAANGVPARVRAGAAVAIAGAAGFGALDDLREEKPLRAAAQPVPVAGEGVSVAGGGLSRHKGLRGHLGALASGDLTTGGLKVLGIGASGVVAAAFLRPGRPGGPLVRGLGVVADGATVAGAANLVNLLDLRPGRALKVVLACASAGAARGPAAPLLAAAGGSAAVLLAEDLGERAMLGDTGSNAAGALLGAAAVVSLGRGPRSALLGLLVAMTLASERVSFTRVIERTPVLRRLDSWGRRAR